MSDKIEEIRERYAGYSLNSGNAGKANEDRGWLLAEVERLRADNERLTRLSKRLGESFRGHWEYLLPRLGVPATGSEIRRLDEQSLYNDRIDDENARLCAEIERLTRERDEARAEVERMQELLRGISINMVDLIEQLTRERDTLLEEVEKLLAENERLRAEMEKLRADIERIENDAWLDGAKHGTPC